ncbi:transposase, IS605 OrfB family, central region [Melghirimyces algeriensis]|uniref:Transposase, IS605 OrfB family, central region n=1 Tax=Melghirimyces algeriensis TaxID=910412 RepID=A0A521CKX3_9BACL|nr:transposase, IS605 OrfB family, central region [Melghirimyces algeriensis]
MPTIILRLELHKPIQAKQDMYQRMAEINTAFANWLLVHLWVNRNLHSWAFYQLKEFIRYKVEMADIRFEEVKAEYTSQTCKCDHREKANRKGLRFQCKQCGYTCHADLNGAINIGKAISGLAT